MSIGIYKYTNKINGNIYIGQSNNIEKRFKNHLYDSLNRAKTSIDKAIKKYGIENFSFEIVELCQEEELNEREIYWIAYYDAYENGYNETIGGKSLKGENHPRAILTEQDVWNIRESYGQGIQRKIVFEPYLKRSITKRCLLKVWNNENWPTVHEDVYTEENKNIHKAQVSHSDDQIGLSSLQRAISQEKIDLMLIDFNNGMTINAIASKYQRDNGTVQKYINKPIANTQVKYHGRTIKNIETNRIFDSISAAARWAKCGATTLTRHLTTDCVAGKIPETGEPAHWIEIE